MVKAGNEPGGNMSRYVRHGSLEKTTDCRCYWTGCSKTEPTNIEWRQPLEGASNTGGAHDKAPHVSLPGTRRAMCTVFYSEVSHMDGPRGVKRILIRSRPRSQSPEQVENLGRVTRKQKS